MKKRNKEGACETRLAFGCRETALEQGEQLCTLSRQGETEYRESKGPRRERILAYTGDLSEIDSPQKLFRIAELALGPVAIVSEGSEIGVVMSPKVFERFLFEKSLKASNSISPYEPPNSITKMKNKYAECCD